MPLNPLSFDKPGQRAAVRMLLAADPVAEDLGLWTTRDLLGVLHAAAGFIDRNRTRDVHGALTIAARRLGHDAVTYAMRVVSDHIDADVRQWQYQPDRTTEEVAAALRGAARDLAQAAT